MITTVSNRPRPSSPGINLLIDEIFRLTNEKKIKVMGKQRVEETWMLGALI